MKISSLNEQGEEEEETQKPEFTRSVSELVLTCSLGPDDSETGAVEMEPLKDEGYAGGLPLVEYRIELVDELDKKTLSSFRRRWVNNPSWKGRWLTADRKAPSLNIYVSPAVRRCQGNRRSRKQHKWEKWISFLSKVASTVNEKQRFEEDLEPDEEKLCQLLANINVSCKNKHWRKSLTWEKATTIPRVAFTVSFR